MATKDSAGSALRFKRKRRTRRGSPLRLLVPVAAALTAIVMVCAAQRGNWPAHTRWMNPRGRTETVRDTLRAFSTDVWAFRLSGHQRARIAVYAAQTAALACRVRDPAARTIEYERREHACNFEWIPARTGAYRLEINNTRNTAAPYSIVVSH